MRFIDLDSLDLSQAGLQEALSSLAAARSAVLAEPDEEKRKDLIKKYQRRWSAMREHLATLSADKCWYVECRNPGADDDVDHYRPKGRVNGVPGHPGYYWLAFDWRNLRLSCHRANRKRKNPVTGKTGGKADYFPLIDESKRAYAPSDNLAAEQPLLLDPTNRDDPGLLTFSPGGDAQLSPKYLGNSIAERRVRVSLELLHLNWPQFTEDRKRLYNNIDRLVQRGRRADPRRGSTKEILAFANTIADLRELMDPYENYSAAASEYIMLYRSEWWVEKKVLGKQ